MSKEGTIINESQLSEFLSNTGKGKNFPEGTALRYYPEKIIIGKAGGKPQYRDNDGTIKITQQIKDLNNATSIVGGKIVKMQKKRVGGRPTPTRDTATEFTKGKKGKLKQETGKVADSDLKDMGNIGSMFGMGSQTMKKDLELLREERRKQKITPKPKPTPPPLTLKKGGINIDYRTRKGGLFNKRRK